MTFVQIVEFDWLSGRQKGSIFVKMFKNLLLRNHKRDEAVFAKTTSLSDKTAKFQNCPANFVSLLDSMSDKKIIQKNSQTVFFGALIFN